MTDLPTGWAWTTLGEIADSTLGKMLDRGKDVVGGQAVPYLRNVNVQWGVVDLESLLDMEMTEEEERFFSLRHGDLLVCEGGEIGRAAVWKSPREGISFQKALHRVRPCGGIDSRYLMYFFMHMAESGGLLRYATGSTIKHLPQQRLKTIEVPLPPLAEQHRIVAALEDHLSRVDAGEAAYSTAARRLESFRRSALARAVDSTQSNQPVYVQLGEVAKVRNGVFVSRAGSEPDGVPILRIGSVRPLSLNVDDFGYSRMSEEELRDSEYLLASGDLLFTRYNGNPDYVGACAVVEEGHLPLTYPDKLIRVSVDRRRAIPEFVAMQCTVGAARAHIEERIRTTAGQAGISGRDLKSVPVWLPSIEEQRARVAEFKQLVMDTVRPASVAMEKVGVRAGHLRRALLREAFAGRLVEQDLGDESASVLLERIRVERGNAPKARRGRKAEAVKAEPVKEIDRDRPLPEPVGDGTQGALDLGL
ncbi:restriction endonuclease subunit S [Saccharopolyspora shandongensis]|uniref:restriction endonuclease subunit S n=1 Tax=Saccharopolyspora shandongensis TaxID=418495 RepID=UPI0033FE1B07